jgi:hypothetical protein
LVSENISRAARLYAFVKAQLDKDALNLMEPDAAAMKRLEVKLSKTNMPEAQQKVLDLSIEEIIRESNRIN